MSLFSSIHLAANSLKADQIALQVVGQNIANANTDGYIREEVVLSPGPTQRLGGLLLGTGVHVEAVIQKIDKYLEERLRGAVSERSSTETQEETYIQLESLLNELSDIDLSTSMSNFFSSISEILNQPEDVSVRNLAVLQGETLASNIVRLGDRVTQLRSDLNDQVEGIADRINRLTEEVRDLNVRIAEAEGGDTIASDAVGLRDQRLTALEELAGLIDIQVREQDSGGVVVYTNGFYLVFEGERREVKVAEDTDRGLTVSNVLLADTNSPLDSPGGELHGLLTARDDILGGFLDGLNEFAQTLAFEFNKVFSSGQGLNGFQELTSGSAVEDVDLPLDEAGLPFTPENGSFQVVVRNRNTGLSQTTDVFVDLNGLDHDTTLSDLAAALDAIDGLSATVTPEGKLTLTSDSAELEFFFANDTSAILASLGLNTFFTGSTARSLGVNPILREDPAKFAAARIESPPGSEPDDDLATANARILANLPEQAIASGQGSTLTILYDRLVAETAQGSTVARALADGARTFEGTLRGQKLSVSGVNIDEEAVRMIAHQHSFQAAARYITTLRDLMDVMVSL